MKDHTTLFKNAIDENPELVEYLLKAIDESSNREILIKPSDVAQELPIFRNLEDESILWGLKWALYFKDIFVSEAHIRDINPKTGKQYMVLKLRRLVPNDELPETLKRYL